MINEKRVILIILDLIMHTIGRLILTILFTHTIYQDIVKPNVEPMSFFTGLYLRLLVLFVLDVLDFLSV